MEEKKGSEAVVEMNSGKVTTKWRHKTNDTEKLCMWKDLSEQKLVLLFLVSEAAGAGVGVGWGGTFTNGNFYCKMVK